MKMIPKVIREWFKNVEISLNKTSCIWLWSNIKLISMKCPSHQMPLIFVHLMFWWKKYSRSHMFFILFLTKFLVLNCSDFIDIWEKMELSKHSCSNINTIFDFFGLSLLNSFKCFFNFEWNNLFLCYYWIMIKSCTLRRVCKMDWWK
jgi:hypothetical protein